MKQETDVTQKQGVQTNQISKAVQQIIADSTFINENEIDANLFSREFKEAGQIPLILVEGGSYMGYLIKKETMKLKLGDALVISLKDTKGTNEYFYVCNSGLEELMNKVNINDLVIIYCTGVGRSDMGEYKKYRVQFVPSNNII